MAGFFAISIMPVSGSAVVGWGDNTYGQADPPPHVTNAVAVAAGGYHSLALTPDGRVVVWGYQDVPSGFPTGGVVALDSGWYLGAFLHSHGWIGTMRGSVSYAARDMAVSGLGFLALMGDGSPIVTVPPRPRWTWKDNTVTLTVKAAGKPPLAYQWQRDGDDLDGATADQPTLENLTATGNSSRHTLVR